MRILKINLFYECSAQCEHCRFGCRNDVAHSIPDIETPYETAATLQKHFGLDYVVILGGEPSLHAKEVHTLISRISALGIPTRVETNAVWAGSDEEADAFLQPLAPFKTSIMLSSDAFHEPFVAAENVTRAVRACDRLGLKVNLEMPYLDIENKANANDQRTLELKQAMDGKVAIYEGGVIFTGRAAQRYGEEYAKGKGVPKETCTAVPWWVNSEIDRTDLLIYEPGGWITKGCGVAIGNVHRTGIVEMLEGYDAQKHPIFSVLMNEGPMGLARMAEKYGYVMRDDYADKCHLCFEARQVLKPYFDDVLQPEQHYGKE